MNVNIRHVSGASAFLLIATACAGSATNTRTEAPRAHLTGTAPEGFVEMYVAGIIATEGGPAVLLHDDAERTLLPINIGAAEAYAIQLRLERRRFPRPLTHDLLDTIVSDLGGAVEKIHVDEVRGEIFVGTIFLRTPKGLIEIDSRPSDSIALALGRRVPIFVAEQVVARMALSGDPNTPTDIPAAGEPVASPNPPVTVQTM